MRFIGERDDSPFAVAGHVLDLMLFHAEIAGKMMELAWCICTF